MNKDQGGPTDQGGPEGAGGSAASADLGPDTLRQTFAHFPTGVTAVCALVDASAAAEHAPAVGVEHAPAVGGGGPFEGAARRRETVPVPVGMAASSFAPVSLSPPLVLFCAANQSLTWPRLRTADRLGLSVLSEHQAALCRQLAGPLESRFEGVSWRTGDGAAVLLDGAAAWLECSLFEEMPAGDHVIVVLQVLAVTPSAGTEPLVFHQSRFRSLAL